MAVHNDLGKQGEEEALSYLRKKGYKFICSNYRFKHLEIDLIMRKADQLIVVEVKTRSSNGVSNPETAVNRKKQKQLIRATNQYIQEKNIDLDVRFDIISLVGSSGKWKINHMEDAFYPIL